MRIKKYQQYNEDLTTSKDYKCSICGSEVYVTHGGGNFISLQCGSDDARFWDFPRGSKQQKKSYNHFTKSIIYVKRSDFSIQEAYKTGAESEISILDDSTTMARHQLFNSDTMMAFNFNGQLISNEEDIKMLISKYNEMCNRSDEWVGGPVNKEFSEYFKKYIMSKLKSEKIFFQHNPWKPSISLIIETPDYGKIGIGFSVKTKKCVSLDAKDLKKIVINRYDESVMNRIITYTRTNIYNPELSIDETINLLRLNVLNKIEWDWIEK